MKKLSLLFGLIPMLLFAESVSAAGGCQPVYGGGSVCQKDEKITINKTVQNPQTSLFVDSLGTNDPHYQPGQTVTFRITVANTSAGKVKNVIVKDLMPTSLQIASGNGIYDTATHVLSFQIDRLDAKSTKTFNVQGRINDNNALPGNNSLVCLTNGATAESGKTLVQDNSQFCVEKSGTTGTGVTNQTSEPSNMPSSQPAMVPNQTKGGQIVYPTQGNTKSPATGPEVLGYLLLAPLGAAGVLLRRKSR